MNVALVQMPMAYTIAENVATIVRSLCTASEMGADVAVFPECAVIGYHHEMGAELSPEVIDDALEKISQTCAEVGIAAIVGTAYYGDKTTEKPWNAVAIYAASGELIAVYPKLMLSRTEVHLDLFSVGKPETRQCFELLGQSCAILICCELCGELGDTKAIYRDMMPLLDARPDIVFVPGIFDMAPGNDITATGSAQELATEFETTVVVVNWPEWGGPDAAGYLGASMAIDAQGQTLAQAERDQTDILLVTV